MLDIIFGLLGIGLFVFIHETGHFIAARLCGVEVEVFSLGFGKKLVGFTHKGTTYQIALFPLGGFCKMKGEMISAAAEPEAFEKAMTESGSFLQAKWWKKMIIAAAGPFANLIFAILIFTITSLIGYSIFSSDNRILLAKQPGKETPAQIAGLKDGDRIIEINNQKIYYFEQIREFVSRNPLKELDIKIERDNQVIKQKIIPEKFKIMGRLGIYSWDDAVIGTIRPDTTAALIGLQPKDKITHIDSQPVETVSAFYSMITEKKPEKVTLTILRNNETFEKVLNFTYKEDGEFKDDPGIGFQLKKFHTPPYTLGEAFLHSVAYCFDMIRFTIEGIAYLFTPEEKKLNEVIAGPVQLTMLIGNNANSGFTELGFLDGLAYFIRFISGISVLIGFMNMLPLPALDGGMIVFALIMQLFKKKITAKVLYGYQIFGVVIVLILLTLAVFSDIFYLFKLF